MPLVTVAEVVRFGLPAGSSVLAGRAGLSKTVTWARQLRARPATLGSVEQGELWLLSSGALHQAGDPRAVARMVREVADAGVVAFVMVEAPTQEALAAADEAAAPIVLLPPDISLMDVEKAIVAFVVDRDQAIRARVQEVYDQLIATLVEDRGSELIANTVHEVSGKAVYLLDEHFQATVQAGGNARTADALTQLRRRFWERQLGNVQDRLITLRSGDDDALAAVVRPLHLRGAVEGYLLLIGQRDDFGDFDYLVADRTTLVLAIELAKQSAIVEARLRVQGDFLEDLLDRPSPLTPQLANRARALGYDLTQPHAVFVLRPRGSADRETAPTPRQYQRFVDAARRRLVLANVASLVREYEGAVQVLAPAPFDGVSADYARMAEWVEGLRSDLETSLAPERLPIVAGVGRSPDGTLTHHAALQEAVQAATIASRLPPETSTLHFANLGALRLIFHLAGNPELQAFQRDLLGRLEDYDNQHKSEFVQTLEAFFQAGGNHMQAARNLHVHRNTLIYRLERIREMLGGANLEDPDTRLNLQLALKIRAAFGVAAA